MYAIRLPSGEFLDLPQDFALNFELNNQVFTTGRSDVLPGAFTFPADLPLTDRNRYLLGHPNQITNAYKFKKITDVEVHCYGIPMFKGELLITDVTKSRVRISIIYNPASPIKNKPIKDLDLGGDRGLGGFDENMALFAATAERPEEYDFAVFPVYAPTFDETDPDITDNDFINFWLDETYTFSIDSVALIPFVRVDYLLKQIFSQLVPGYLFINGFQISHELRRLYLINNYDSRVEQDGNLTTSYGVNLQNHVGEISSNDFLRAIMANFCLGLFSSPFKRSIVLRPLRDLVKAPAKHDWTEFLLDDFTITNDASDTPMKFCHPQFDGATSRVDDVSKLPAYSCKEFFFAALSGLDNGLYYIESEEWVMEVYDVFGVKFAANIGFRRKCKILDETPEFETTLSPPRMYHLDDYGYFPWFEGQGSYWVGGTGNWKRVFNSADLTLVFYRGFQQPLLSSDHERPYAAVDVWNMSGQPLPAIARITDKEAGPSGDYTFYDNPVNSLQWTGPYGLYEQWWRPWHEMLQHGKHVTLQFAMPVRDLIAFSFEDKIHALNMDYMVKKLRVGKTLGRGRVLVEASLVSVI